MSATAAAPQTAASIAEQAVAYRRAHVSEIFAGRIPKAPREGWAIVCSHMEKVAPYLKYSRGDGWWTLEHAVLYPTKEMAEADAKGIPGLKVLFVKQAPEGQETQTEATQP